MRMRRFTALLTGAAAAVAGLTLVASPAAATTVDCVGPEAVKSQSWTFTHTDGTSDTYFWITNSLYNGEYQDIRPGDKVTGTVTLKPECLGTSIGIASYQAPSATLNPDDVQKLFSHDVKSGGNGTYSFSIVLPKSASDGSTCPNKHQDGPETKNKGANTSGAYDSTCDGRPSGNGNGGGNANGRPCAGCVGNADDKNPPGQRPDGSDRNNGYECDGNKGIARENPAHTGCQVHFFQVDVFTGQVLQTVGKGSYYGERLVGAFNGPKA